MNGALCFPMKKNLLLGLAAVLLLVSVTPSHALSLRVVGEDDPGNVNMVALKIEVDPLDQIIMLDPPNLIVNVYDPSTIQEVVNYYINFVWDDIGIMHVDDTINLINWTEDNGGDIPLIVPSVPDGGSTLILLGGALSGLGLVRRRFSR